ncbi:MULTISPECIES: bifunctional diguanylate cyclase/phosphodiesterase [unclassified Roseitalea]|uniref:putative bifunctional diguanylate cyclase/phosphodiesterase n=1 Tax=unclassified Roseitalea TaxID=2639107 RepID=UPI00273D3C38|nr:MULTISPECIES: bifunctional diguanylate cyclase/phosphodiesterase [unclassified Roseitalea]
MHTDTTQTRTRLFRAVTIFASGMGAAILALWAMDIAGLDLAGRSDASVIGAIVLGLATLAGAGSAHAYFVGSDDTSDAYEMLLNTDPVTGLLSRKGFADALVRQMEAEDNASGLKRSFLISLDFDSLRDFNDVYGMETGDALLKVFGERLRRIVDDAGLIARTSGGEFVVVLAGTHDERELRAAVDALLGVMSLPVRVGQASHSVFWNAGVAEIHHRKSSVERMLRNANLARANARTASRGTWSIYHPEMSQVAAYRSWIEAELHGAMQREELHLNYQPKVSASTGETLAYEALLRWNHHRKGIIPPSEFIPVAEHCGLIQQIGDFVLRQVCEDLTVLPPHITVSANVSPAQFRRDDFVPNLARLLTETETDPARLEIEITESLLIRNHVAMRRVLDSLRELGVTLAIDDFGTGYSNLSNLSELRFHTLKIDKSFVDRLGDHDPSAGAMVSSIVGMARSLGAEVVAEGVETDAQATMLKAAGCMIMQGYLYGRPVPLSTILREQQADEEADEREALLDQADNVYRLPSLAAAG